MADQLFDITLVIWLLVAIALLFRLKVFSPQPLRTAPARAGALSLQIFAGIFLLYIGASFVTQVVFVAASTHFQAAPAATAPARLAPLPLPTPTTLPIAPITQPATAPAATSTAPASSQPILIHHDFTPDIEEQFLVAFSELIPCLAILFLASRLVLGGLDGFGLSFRKLSRGIRDGLLGFIIAYPLLIAIGTLAATLFERLTRHAAPIHPTLEMLAEHPSPFQQFLLILFAGCIAPILEEIAFRGLLQSVLAQRRWGLILPNSIDSSYRASPAHRWGAIAVTALIFAAAHGTPEFVPVLFTLALALGYLYERTGNLWAPITLHAAFNLLNIYLTMRTS